MSTPLRQQNDTNWTGKSSTPAKFRHFKDDHYGKPLPNGISRKESPITGETSYVVRKSMGGKRIPREYGPQYSESVDERLSAAKSFLEEKLSEMKENYGSFIDVPDSLRKKLVAIGYRLESAGLSMDDLAELVDLGLKYKQEHSVAKHVSIEWAVEQFLAFKRRENCKESYFQSMGPILRAFSKTFPTKKLDQIRAEDIETMLTKRDFGAVSWNNWRRDLRTFFNFARAERNRWITRNPAEGVALKKIDHDEVTIFSVEQAKKVLAKAVEFYPRLVPFIVVGLFAGLRRSEAQACQWEDINWDHKSLKVRSAKKRGAAYRHVHMEPVLIAWLRWCEPKETGPICTMKYARRNDLQLLSFKTGLDCTDNKYRHSFGSYHLGFHRDKAMTMLEMGHTNQTTFDGYYKKPMPKGEAEPYWELTPEAVLSA